MKDVTITSEQYQILDYYSGKLNMSKIDLLYFAVKLLDDVLYAQKHNQRVLIYDEDMNQVKEIKILNEFEKEKL